MAAMWPGGYGPLRTSRFYDRLEPAPYFAGPAGRFSYSGCHAWAIPVTCGDVPGAVSLVGQLSSAEAGRLEAESGAVCAHVDAFAAVSPVDEKDARRRAITAETIDKWMITYPPLARFPQVEDAGWEAINAALRGALSPERAVSAMQVAAERALA
jgi:ABC-type glycerol-3-phosphate transport system substrate-binding protein